MGVAEGILKHKWTWEEKKKPTPIPYPGAERGYDSDIVNSIDNMKMVEAEKGNPTWNLL